MAQKITAEEAAGLLRDGMTVGVGGFGAYSCPDGLLRAVARAVGAGSRSPVCRGAGGLAAPIPPERSPRRW